MEEIKKWLERQGSLSGNVYVYGGMYACDFADTWDMEQAVIYAYRHGGPNGFRAVASGRKTMIFEPIGR